MMSKYTNYTDYAEALEARVNAFLDAITETDTAHPSIGGCGCIGWRPVNDDTIYRDHDSDCPLVALDKFMRAENGGSDE